MVLDFTECLRQNSTGKELKFAVKIYEIKIRWYKTWISVMYFWLKFPKRSKLCKVQKHFWDVFESFLAIIFPFILPWRGSLLYRNQFNGLPCKTMTWFLYDRVLRHERVNYFCKPFDHRRLTGSWICLCTSKLREFE